MSAAPVTYAQAYAERWPTVEQVLAEVYRRRRKPKTTTAADSNSPKSRTVGGRGGKHSHDR